MHSFAQSIVETVRHPLLILDGDLRVQKANAAFYRVFQGTKAETEGQLLYELAGGQWDLPRLRTLLEQVAHEGSFKDFEIRHEGAQVGAKRMVLDAHLVEHDDGTPMILLAIEDTTDKTVALDALEKLNRELDDRVSERTAQLEAANVELEAFAYSVSHDLRAPLRALDGFSDELLRCYSDRLDDRGQHYLRRLRSGTQRMGQLIDDMLELSQLNRGEMKRESVDLTVLAQAIATELRDQEPDRKVDFLIEPGQSAIGDSSLLAMALENLLGNAWKFTSKNPSATITMGREQQQGAPGFFVRDDGAGFDMAHISKLFGAFQRLHTQREFPGNGVGLAIVQRVVHRHGGRVWAESSLGQGATFHFTLAQDERPI